MDEYRIRVYKYNIHLFLYKYCADSQPYKIKAGRSAILPGLKYSLLTLFLGFWGIFGGRKSIECIGINFSGGLDYTKEITELDYDKQTIYIYNNLPRNTLAKIKIEDVEILVELQNEYLSIDDKTDTLENKDYIRTRLKKIGVTNIDSKDLDSFFAAFENANRID